MLSKRETIAFLCNPDSTRRSVSSCEESYERRKAEASCADTQLDFRRYQYLHRRLDGDVRQCTNYEV
ncbi:hypothetical protein PC123_g19096 [Phytophthora cactorum]|nr:hypothetical protein PC123_g19096 [Phytophthora cactorum]